MTSEAQEHARWSPSSAHRWRRCKASINAEYGLPDKVGREAAEGTIFHTYAELALSLGIDPGYFPTGAEEIVDGHKVAYNDEMIDHMRRGIEYIKFKMGEHGNVPVILMVEQRVKIEPWTGEPGGFGTSDVCIIFPTLRIILVFDWKYGKVVVSPVENDQLSLYALGCWTSFAGEIFDWDPSDIHVEFIIWQPRVPGGGGSWPTTMEALLAEGAKIRQDAEETRDPNAPYTPGTKQCNYCKFAGKCAALAQYNLEQYGLHFDDIEDDLDYNVPPVEPDFDSWTPEKKAWVLLHKSLFERWFKKLHEEAMGDAARGKPYPLLKMVAGNAGWRKWKGKEAEANARRVMLENAKKPEDILKEVILTPAQAETYFGKKKYRELLADYVTQPPGKPIIVPETDPRDPILTYGQEFDRLADDDEDGED
jgi:hypothetical protein